MACSKLHAEGPQILGATLQYLCFVDGATRYNLVKNQDNRQSSKKNNKYHFFVYIRLYLLIMGFDNRQTSKKNNKYHFLYTYGYTS
jgi:hypothetical protein